MDPHPTDPIHTFFVIKKPEDEEIEKIINTMKNTAEIHAFISQDFVGVEILIGPNFVRIVKAEKSYPLLGTTQRTADYYYCFHIEHIDEPQRELIKRLNDNPPAVKSRSFTAVFSKSSMFWFPIGNHFQDQKMDGKVFETGVYKSKVIEHSTSIWS